MNFGPNFAAVCGLAAFMAFSAPASAATAYTYDLAGDTSKAYGDPAWPGWAYVDLTDPNSGATSFPAFSLQVDDTIQVTVALNNPVTFTDLDLFLQEASNTSIIGYDQTVLFSLGGLPVSNPGTGFWDGSAGAAGGLGFAPGFSPDSGSLTFDKIIVNAVIKSLADSVGGTVSSVELLPFPTYIGFKNSNLATTPLPGALLLMTTALGGLGLVARRKRAAA